MKLFVLMAAAFLMMLYCAYGLFNEFYKIMTGRTDDPPDRDLGGGLRLVWGGDGVTIWIVDDAANEIHKYVMDDSCSIETARHVETKKQET